MRVYDSDIRKLLYKNFVNIKEFTSDPATIVVDEMDVCFGTSRIDIAVINGEIHGCEIKSERDNLERLYSQIESYNKVFDTITIVVSEKHILNVIEMVPDWWGIYYISKDKNILVLKREREYKINANIDELFGTMSRKSTN